VANLQELSTELQGQSPSASRYDWDRWYLEFPEPETRTRDCRQLGGARLLGAGMNEGFIVARYLYEQRPDGRYVPQVSVQLPGHPELLIIIDPEGGLIPTAIVRWRWISGSLPGG